jgi:acyl carrier protein
METNVMIKEYIESELVSNSDFSNLNDSDQLLSTGIIDSLGLVKLLAFLNEKFSINVDDSDIIPENFDTVSAITSLVQKKLS